MDDTTRQKKESSLWNKQAAGYDRRTLKIYEDAYALSIQKTRAILAPEHQVLEIGCGTGIIALSIASDVAHVTGTDISPQMIAVAQDKAERRDVPNIDFRVGDGYALPFDDAAFDVVLLFNTLHVVKEPETLLREAHRLLKPAGYLVSATDCYAEPAPLKIRLMLLAQKILKLVGVIPFMWYYKREDLHQLFERCGFTVAHTDVLHSAPVNYYILARKDAPGE